MNKLAVAVATAMTVLASLVIENKLQAQPTFPGGGDGDTNIYYYTNTLTPRPYVPGLKLAIPPPSGTNLFINLLEADPAGTYDIFAASNIVSAPWNDVLGGTNGQTNFTLPFLFTSVGFFRAARTDTPVVDTSGMSVQFSNNDVNTNLTSAIVSGGPAAALAVLVNDTNLADAVWIPFSAIPNVLLGTNDGTYSVMFGYIGSDGQTNWTTATVTLDTTPPPLFITGPTNGTVNQPVIQLTGYSPEALTSLSYDITNAAGLTTNQQVFVLDQFYDINAGKFTTNTFQGFDIQLTNGLNIITLHATDLAGNTTTITTNFTLDYSGKTNPPVLSVNWPQNGMNICGTNFTCNGLVSDPTATITVQLVDTNGDTNVLNATVGRDGHFWAEYLPLSGGTNYLTLIATDATGTNSATTNLMVIQGNIGLAIDAVSAGQTLVTGEIDPSIASSYTIWVNGTAATNHGDGTWTAQIVSIGVGGGVVEAMAIPNSDNGGNGSGGSLDSAGNPNSAQAQATQTPVKAPEGVYIQSYQETKDMTGVIEGGYSILHNFTKWENNLGGSANGNYTLGGLDMWQYQSTWPATAWPQALPTGTTVWDDGTTNNIISLGLAQEHCDITAIVGDQGSILRCTSDTKMKLATGGPAGSTKMNLWVISGSATEIYPPYSPSNPFSDPVVGASNAPVDFSRISVLGKTLGSDGNLYIALPDGTNLDATPVIAGAPNYYTFGVSAQKYRLNITANGNPLSEDRIRRGAYFCVGQLVTFAGVFSPNSIPGLNYTSPIWNYTADYINNHWTDENGCEEYNIAAGPAVSNPTPAWFYNQQTQDATANLGMNCKFNNGQSVYLVRQGKFNVYTPIIQKWSPLWDGPPQVVIEVGQLSLGSVSDTSGNAPDMSFAHYIQSNFSGTAGYTQLITGEFDSNFSYLIDGFQLDNTEWPRGQKSIAVSEFGGQVPFDDGPSVSLATINGTTAMNLSFETYLRFRPDAGNAADNVFVTLRLVTWGVTASATKSNGIWSVGPGSSSSGPTNTVSNAFPTWTKTAHNTF